MRAVEVLPLVPVMWMAGYWSWGEPSSSMSASMRDKGAGAMRRGVARRHAGERVEQVGMACRARRGRH